MTAQVLSSELNNVIQEAKRKNNDLRNAAEKSLQDLKSLSVTSEAQLAADLRRRPHFITPFLIAGKSGNAKLALHGMTCLQRLVASRGLAVERLREVLESFQESCKTGLDVQLKILQCLPQLIQIYGDGLDGDLQASVLQVCSTLQQIKTAAISSTASATFQQIVDLLFEKVESEDDRAGEIPAVTELKLDGESAYVRSAAYDAYRVVQDICLLIEGQKPHFVTNASFSQTFGLGLIEALLNNHGDVFSTHPELAYTLRVQLMPLITRIMSERLAFAVAVRTYRILCILLREHLNTISVECEIPLSLLHHSLDADSSTPWRRALAMEVYRVVYSTPGLSIRLYALLDEQEGRGNVIQDSLGTFVRLAAEKPALIGLGPQSTIPSGNMSNKSNASDRALLEASSVAGVITTGDLAVPETAAPGISTQWSTMKTSCLDHVDKIDPPIVPETYPYSLILSCLNGLSDNMARVILPMVASGHSAKRPLSGRIRSRSSTHESGQEPSEVDNEAASGSAVDHNLREATSQEDVATKTVKSISRMLDTCWPAILASTSTFLYAALDADFYRTLIRSYQRFTQVAGLLELSTPRDAFLTTLAKAAVPANVIRTDRVTSASGLSSPRIGSNSSAFASVESFLTQASLESSSPLRQQTYDTALPSLSQRNLMCLRALINLAIALGAILESSWVIVLQNLQRADSILAETVNATGGREFRQNVESSSGQSSLGAEITALEGAISRLFQSTVDYSDEAFSMFLEELCGLLPSTAVTHDLETPPGTPGKIQRINSLGGPPPAVTQSPRSIHFVIAKLGDIARINIHRLALQQTRSTPWQTLIGHLTRTAISTQFESTSRLMAADVLGNIVIGVIVAVMNENEDIRGEVQARALECLANQISRLHAELNAEHLDPSGTDLDVHRAALEALRAILEQCGDSLIAGWKTIFTIIQSTFGERKPEIEATLHPAKVDSRHNAAPISPKIARSAFASVQLICSDFLPNLRNARVVDLIDIMSTFCSEYHDVNISLTTITLFWEVSDFLRTRIQDHDPCGIAGSNPDSVLKSAISAAGDGSYTSTWLVLLCRLASMIQDKRAEIRSGAVQTIFRMLDSYGEVILPETWQLCFHGVLLAMLKKNLEAHHDQTGTRTSKEDTASISGTTSIILSGLANTTTRNIAIIMKMADFEEIWFQLHKTLAQFTLLKDSVVDEALFKSSSNFLAGITDDTDVPDRALEAVFDLWAASVPIGLADATNDKAIFAYLDMFKELHRLRYSVLTTKDLLVILDNLQLCATGLHPGAYVTDVDSMTGSQTEILRCLEMVGLEAPEAIAKHISTLAHFTVLPYVVTEPNVPRKLSYIAFAKASMSLLSSACRQHAKSTAVIDSGAVRAALDSLAQNIRLKYQWLKQGKAPSLWSTATTTAVEILDTILPVTRQSTQAPRVISDLWESAVDVAIAVGEANLTLAMENKQLLSDESFDLTAIQALLKCFRGEWGEKSDLDCDNAADFAWLGSPSVEGTTRVAWVAALARISLIHEPQSAIPSPGPAMPASLTGPPATPLSLVHQSRPGRTYNPAFSPRLRISYLCLDELVAIVAGAPSSGNKGTKNPESGQNDTSQYANILAETAFPYLVLRLAIPLQRYIADQPLRGRMPTPQSQRLELLHVLRKAREMRCYVGKSPSEVQAETEHESRSGYVGNSGSGTRVAGSSRGKVYLHPEKRHLEWLIPLVSNVARLARGDGEIADACAGVLDAAIMIE